MIVLGIDPGSRSTGLALIETRPAGGIPDLLECSTVRRADGGPLTEVPAAYLRTIRDELNRLDDTHAGEYEGFLVDRVVVESITRPRGFAHGKRAPIDPGPIIGTGIVLGAILAHYPAEPDGPELRRLNPSGHGHLLPLHHYPDPLATNGKGNDKRRHERSAFDVAMMGSRHAHGGVEW